MSGKNKKDEFGKGAGSYKPEDRKAIYEGLLMKLADRSDIPTTSTQSYFYEEQEIEDTDTDESDFEELEEAAATSTFPTRPKPKVFTKSNVLYKKKMEKEALRRALAEQERAKNAAKKKN